jgi:endoglucanase
VLSEEDRQKVIPMSDLFIDVGLPESRVLEWVHTGDLVTLSRRMVTLQNHLVAGKAFDDRSAVVCVAEALRLLSTIKHAWDVYGVANVQEEVGLRGAMTSTFQINPDIAIAIDVSHADQPNTSEIGTVPLNDGMGISVGPNIHPLIYERLVETAAAQEIPFKVLAEPGATGTNAWAMQVVREGIPTGLLNIPLRYMHTSVETLSIGDLERTSRLLAYFCASLDGEFLKQLKGETNGAEPKPAGKPKRTRTRRKK